MFEGYEELNTQDVEWMQEVIRTLLAQTFLPERKYDKKYGRMMPDRMYDFCDRHLEFLTEYFAVAGINHLSGGNRRNRGETAETCDHLSAAVKTDL